MSKGGSKGKTGEGRHSGDEGRGGGGGRSMGRGVGGVTGSKEPSGSRERREREG